ncbi:nucleoside diphosphate kinase regulator [Vibrio cholerae]|nr:nucleoside diphosphate kinase regulator [Vibrio cholerae]
MSQLNTIVVSTRDMDRISQLMDNLATLSPFRFSPLWEAHCLV